MNVMTQMEIRWHHLCIRLGRCLKEGRGTRHGPRVRGRNVEPSHWRGSSDVPREGRAARVGVHVGPRIRWREQLANTEGKNANDPNIESKYHSTYCTVHRPGHSWAHRKCNQIIISCHRNPIRLHVFGGEVPKHARGPRGPPGGSPTPCSPLLGILILGLGGWAFRWVIWFVFPFMP